LFSEVINAGAASVLVDQTGKIVYFNQIFKSLMTDRLQFEFLPSNIFTICKDVNSNFDQLSNLFTEALNFKKNGNREEFQKTIELRIPRLMQQPP